MSMLPALSMAFITRLCAPMPKALFTDKEEQDEHNFLNVELLSEYDINESSVEFIENNIQYDISFILFENLFS